MRQAGRYMQSYRDLRERMTMMRLCKNPALCAEVTVDAARTLEVDAAILFSDLLLPLEPMGIAVDFPGEGGPRLDPPVRSPADVERLAPVDTAAALGYVLEAVGLARARLPRDTPLIGFAGGPFTLASYMIEGGSARHFLRTKKFMHDHPDAWRLLMEKLSRVVADFLVHQHKAGAQVLQLFDSWAGCLSPSDYREFVLPHSKAVFAALPAGTPAIHFATQTGGGVLSLMREAGGDILGLDWRVNLRETWDRLGPGVGVMGNLDPAVLLASPSVVERETRRVLAEAGARPGFIFNLGHGVLPTTPVENVQLLVRIVKGDPPA
jgi:uroporphyrinogen decarboxylase